VVTGFGRKPVKKFGHGRSVVDRGYSDSCGRTIAQDQAAEFGGILVGSGYI
jgi:hypothetical protein